MYKVLQGGKKEIAGWNSLGSPPPHPPTTSVEAAHARPSPVEGLSGVLINRNKKAIHGEIFHL